MTAAKPRVSAAMEGSARIAASRLRNDECELPLIIPQHDASAARCDQLDAEFLKVSAVVVCDADVVTHSPPFDVAAKDRDRFEIADHRRILLLDHAIDRPRFALRPIGCDLHAPARHGFSLFVWIRRAYCRNRTGGRLLAFDAFENKLMLCIIE